MRIGKDIRCKVYGTEEMLKITFFCHYLFVLLDDQPFLPPTKASVTLYQLGLPVGFARTAPPPPPRHSLIHSRRRQAKICSHVYLVGADFTNAVIFGEQSLPVAEEQALLTAHKF